MMWLADFLRTLKDNFVSEWVPSLRRGRPPREPRSVRRSRRRLEKQRSDDGQ